MSKSIPPDSPLIAWQGAVSIEHGDGWVMPWRIPYRDAGLFPPMERVPKHARHAAGVRIAFRSDTDTVAGRVELTGEPDQIDVFIDGDFDSTVTIENGRFSTTGLPGHDKLIELWLPQFAEFRLGGLEIADGANIAPYVDTRPKWVVYGSSITQCRAAESPSRTWPAFAARDLGLDLTCLGFGASCQMESMVARMIRDLPADYLTMKVGVNIYSVNGLSPRTFRAAVIGFVKIVREKHPDTPFAVVSPIYSAPKETTPNAVGFTLEAMRAEVAEAVGALQAHGDNHVHYIDGLKLLGPESARLLPDDTHPSAEGYKLLAQSLVREVGEGVWGRKREE